MTDRPRMARRAVIKSIAAAIAAPAWLSGCAVGPAGYGGEALGPSKGPRGTLTDPDLVNPATPWPLLLTDAELHTLAALCDLIIPADERSPAASEIGAHAFIDEWVSAPYEGQESDRDLVRTGLTDLDSECDERFDAPFAELAVDQQTRLCDLICHAERVPPGMESLASFFDKVRTLTLMAFYTTREGMADIKYVGNVPLPRWDPPPPAVLRHVGLI